MPIRLEVTGENHEEFAKHLAGVVALAFQRVAGAVGLNIAPQTGGVGQEALNQRTIEAKPAEKAGPEKASEPEKAETRGRGRPKKQVSDEAKKIEAEKAAAPEKAEREE